MMFTCGHCGHKDTKTFTKKAYHSSVVIIRCDGCDNNHLVADNLGWFRDEKVNIEQISKEHGNNMTKVNSSPRLQQVLNKIKFVGVKGEVHGVSTSEKDDVIKNIGGAEDTKKN
jgi:protein import protein ZIM17